MARVYLVNIYVAGAVCYFLSQTLAFPAWKTPPGELAVLVLLAALAGGKKIELTRRLFNEEAGSMSLGFAVTFTALLKYGPGTAVLVSSVGCLSSCLFPKRQPWHQMAFNLALGALEGLVGGLIFVALGGWTLQKLPQESLPAVTAAALTFYLINTVGVAIIISMCTGNRLWALWKENFMWTAPSYFATASVSAVAIYFFKDYIIAILVCVAMVAWLVYQSYAVYVSRAEEKQAHIEELQHGQEHLASLYLATIKSLALAIDAKDKHTHQHILRVQRYAVAIADELGLSGVEREAVNTGALLHDIGKLGVPEYVLLKPGRLTDDEFDKIKKHPEIGAAILDPVDFPWPVLPVVRHHHEKWDGSGYPDGLKGSAIPLTARIMAVADVYDALTSSRSYRRAWSHEKTVETIRRGAGTHFDPVVVDAFAKVIDGVIESMARDGEGPLAALPQSLDRITDKADLAAVDISRASAELWVLYEVAQMLSSSIGTGDTSEILARKLATIFPGVLCAILVSDAGGPMLRVAAAHGLNSEYFLEAHTISERSLSASVLRKGGSFMGDFDPDDLMLVTSEALQWMELRTCLVVPLAFSGEKIGTINLYHPEGGTFSPYDVQLLEMIAERAGPALHNGLLFDRTRGQALRDPLTGIANVRHLTEFVDSRCAEYMASGGRGDGFSVLCLDLDSFKPINDNFGHQKGDEVLQSLAALFVSLVGPGDLVARYGGDEFVIVLEGAGQDRARAIAESIVHAAEEYDPGLTHYKLGTLHLGVSVGVASFPQDGADCPSLISAADRDMYANKAERKLGALTRRSSGEAA